MRDEEACPSCGAPMLAECKPGCACPDCRTREPRYDATDLTSAERASVEREQQAETMRSLK